MPSRTRDSAQLWDLFELRYSASWATCHPHKPAWVYQAIALQHDARDLEDKPIGSGKKPTQMTRKRIEVQLVCCASTNTVKVIYAFVEPVEI
jgi:hypothetical protein